MGKKNQNITREIGLKGRKRQGKKTEEQVILL